MRAQSVVFHVNAAQSIWGDCDPSKYALLALNSEYGDIAEDFTEHFRNFCFATKKYRPIGAEAHDTADLTLTAYATEHMSRRVVA